MLLGDRAWPDVDRPILAVPVGSCEQHGPHLPVATDTLIAEALATGLARARREVVVTPALTVTASGEHAGFPGTLSIGTDVMSDVVVELARSADWAAGVVFVNGHGGNAAAMQRAEAVLRHERRNVLVWWPRVPDGDLHAGRTETSLMLALHPHLVSTDRLEPGPTPTTADLVRLGVQPLSPSGVLGDPTQASADAGHRILADLTAQLTGAVGELID